MKKVGMKVNDFLPSILPIVVGVAFMPLVLRLSVQEYPVEYLTFYTNGSTIINIYTHYKSLTIVTLAIVSILFFAYLVDNNYLTYKSLNQKKFYPLYGYMVIVVLSFFFSQYPFFSRVGYIDRHENVFVLLSYITLFIYTASVLTNKRFLNILIFVWSIAIIVLFYIGITQFQGNSILGSSFFKSIIIPSAYADTYNLNPTSTVIIQTFGNPNYVVFYAALSFPFFFVLTLLSKNWWHKGYYALISGMLIFNASVSNSRNGLVGIFASLAVLVILLLFTKIKYRLFMFSFVVLVGLGVIGYHVVNETTIYKKMITLIEQIGQTTNYSLNNIYTGDVLLIDHDDFIFIAQVDPAARQWNFFDQEDQLLTVSMIEGKYVVVDEDGNPDLTYEKISFTLSETNGNPEITTRIDNTNWRFVFIYNQFYFINSLGNLESLGEVATLGFEDNLRFGSSRGYIWSRSLPIMLDHWLLGTGPDTYALVFPQNDRVGKLNGLRRDMVVDKPHNILLNYGVNTGVISVILLVWFWIAYGLWSIKLYIGSTFKQEVEVISLAAFAGVIGYLASGMVNDTYLAVTTVFWVVLGIGFASNQLIEANKKQDNVAYGEVVVHEPKVQREKPEKATDSIKNNQHQHQSNKAKKKKKK